MERIRRRRWIALYVGVGLLAVGTVGTGFASLRQYVETRAAYPTEPPRVVLANRPAWMSDDVADQIEAAARPLGAHSAFERQLLIDVADSLQTDPRSAPWIRKVVQVRREYGLGPGDTVAIDCDWRVPAALVHWGEDYWLVDSDAVKLPVHYTAEEAARVLRDPEGRVRVRVVEGVTRPPPDAGRPWVGEDLAAALDMVQLLFDKPWSQEIIAVNVANFGGRHDRRAAHLVLTTRDATEVRWGLPVKSKERFAEVSTAQKIRYLEQIVQKYNRVDAGHSAVDIRFDRVTFPNDEPGEQHVDRSR